MGRQSHHIRRKPASNLHHAIRLAEAIGLPLNTWATLNFSMTACPLDGESAAFADLRNDYYRHWARRPGKRSGATPYTPAFVWVLEAPGGVMNAHWLLHVPKDRRADFEQRLPQWMSKTTSTLVILDRTIDVRDTYNARGAGRYMLKGMEEVSAAFYGIQFEDQGKVTGRRSDYTRNVGPKIKRKMRREGQYPQARVWRPFPIAQRNTVSEVRSI